MSVNQYNFKNLVFIFLKGYMKKANIIVILVSCIQRGFLQDNVEEPSRKSMQAIQLDHQIKSAENTSNQRTRGI